MRRGATVILTAWCAVAAAGAQGQVLPSLRVYSELQRIDPFGKVIEADRPRRAELKPREVLSPAVVRNAHATFHVALTVPEGAPFTLHVGQNPEGFFGVTLYRETHVRRGSQWIPDTLERLELPYSGVLPDAPRPISGQTTIVLLADLWTDFDSPARRSRIEFQLYANGGWIIYPLEVRVMPVIVPGEKSAGIAPAGLDAPADAAARAALTATLCGATGPGAPGGTSQTVRGILARNAVEDAALLRSIAAYHGRPTVDSMLSLAGVVAPEGFCQKPQFPGDRGPEWYLKFRDALYRMVN